MTLKKANEHRNAWFEGVQKCNLDETLFTVMERIVRAEVHRLVVVDESEKVIGIISLSDLLLYLVLRPSGDGIGDSESLRATDPILKCRERAERTGSQLVANNSNESIEEETNHELEAERAENSESDKNNNSNSGDELELAEEAMPTNEEEVKTEDNENNNDSTPPHTESVADDDDEVDLMNNGSNNLSNTLNMQREVAMVSE